MVIDFRLLKEELGRVLQELDHRYLNDLDFFQREEPSSENIARYIFGKLKERLKDQGVSLHRVTAWESEGAGASYMGGEG